MFKALVRTAAVAASLFAVGAAQALPSLELSFRDSTGVVSPTDSVEVWMTFSVGSSGGFAFDSAAGYPFGLDPLDIPDQGSRLDNGAVADFATYTAVFTQVAYGCNNTFSPNCNGSPYTFAFNFGGDPAKPAFNGQSAINIAANDSRDYLLGTFTPVGGAAPEGTYQLRLVDFSLQFLGLDADGHSLSASIALADTVSTCDRCVFEREVVAAAVPEPSTYGLMALGLLAVGGIARRRRLRAAAPEDQSARS